MKNQLLKRLEDKTAKCAVIGMGYVGLPLAVELAESGFHVQGIDILEDKVEKLNKGISYVGDITSDRLAPLVSSGFIKATTSFDGLKDADIISICVPTPLAKTKDPDISYIQNSADMIKANLRPGQLVVLDSTTYPGTTREILLPAFEETGLKCGKDFFLAFSPERVDPGNEKYHTKNTPKVVGGIDAPSGEVATACYKHFIDTVVTVSSAEAAEMTKILENTFRSVNIGLVNEMAIMCDKLHIDVWEVIRAAATKPFGYMPFFPGPGLGGHCIPIDPHYLSWKLKTVNYNARFIELAGDINSHMPGFVVFKLAQTLNKYKKCMNGAKILMLGVAYKPDIDDLRESPALDIIAMLKTNGAEVTYHDCYVPKVWVGKDSAGEDKYVHSRELTKEVLEESDLVVITTNHSNLDLEFVAKHAKVVFDTRDALRGVEGEADVVRL